MRKALFSAFKAALEDPNQQQHQRNQQQNSYQPSALYPPPPQHGYGGYQSGQPPQHQHQYQYQPQYQHQVPQLQQQYQPGQQHGGRPSSYHPPAPQQQQQQHSANLSPTSTWSPPPTSQTSPPGSQFFPPPPPLPPRSPQPASVTTYSPPPLSSPPTSPQSSLQAFDYSLSLQQAQGQPILTPQTQSVSTFASLPSSSSTALNSAAGQQSGLYGSYYAPPQPQLYPQSANVPQSVPEAADPPKIRKVLCLDGGGVRGLSEIFLLKAIMRRLSDERGFDDWRTIEPWQEFDMICGTSTGGLLAIMLGRLRMSVAECEDAYTTMSREIFTPVRSAGNIAGRGKDFLTANGRFSSEPMEKLMRKLLSDRGMREDELLWDTNRDSQSPLVFVCATSSYGGPTCIRSYRNKQVEDQILPECQVWQAARATSAASTFFPPVTIGRRTFIDGSEAGDNNPIEVAEREAREMFKDQDCMFVSLGTGKGTPRDITGNLNHLIQALLKILTESERRNARFFNQHQQWVLENKLFRFNVTTGLGDIGLDEHKSLNLIDEFTSLYFQEEGVSAALARCARALKDGGQRLHIIAGDDLALHFEKLKMTTKMVVICAHCRKLTPFGTDFYYCSGCDSNICQACRNIHDYTHAELLLRCECISWQSKLKGYPETKTCQKCLEPRRCRMQCKSCDWVLCLECYGENEYREAGLKSHRETNPDHRLFVTIMPPWYRKIPAPAGECPCATLPFPGSHCDCCHKVILPQQQVYWCRTCRIDFSSAGIICKACFDSEPQDHISSHEFQVVIYYSEQTSDDDIVTQNKRSQRCIDCNFKVLPPGAYNHHPHKNLAVVLGPAALEAHRMWVIKNCALRTTIDEGREQARNVVSGPSCSFCGWAVSWGETLGLCLWPNCCKVWCNLCLQSNRIYHRHTPLQQVIFQLKSTSTDAQQYTNQITCDCCSKVYYRFLFTGVECSDCKNHHFCVSCIQEVTKGTLTFSNNGVHRCRGMRWTFWRLA